MILLTRNFLALALSISLSLSLSNASPSPPVKVSLRSSWPAPPLLLEIIESAAAENASTFFPLLDALTDPRRPAPRSPAAAYAHGMAVLSEQWEGEGATGAVEKALALHAAAPQIAAFYAWYADNGLGARVAGREGCGSWVDWEGEVVCDVETLAALSSADDAPRTDAHPKSKAKLLPFDHVYPSPLPSAPARTAILYASLSSPNFRALHAHLYALASSPAPRVAYVLRYVPEHGEGDRREHLSGWGVGLDLKKMDYLALDDRRSHHAGKSTTDTDVEDAATEEDMEDDHLLRLLAHHTANNTDTGPLTEDELQDIGYHAAHLLHTAPAPLRTLRLLAQDFPKYAVPLARRALAASGHEGGAGDGAPGVFDAVFDEVQANHFKAAPGVNMVWLNGAVVADGDANPFALLRLMRKERALIRSLTALSPSSPDARFALSPTDAIALLTHRAVAAAHAQSSQGGAVTEGLFDASDRREGGGVVVWWNDLERDSRYAQWGSSLNLLLRPTYPGQFPSLRINLFNIVLALDLARTSSLQFLGGTVAGVVGRGYPFRFGLVPLVETGEGAQMARVFGYLVSRYGRAKTMGFVKSLAKLEAPLHLLPPTVDMALVRAEFDALVAREADAGKEVAEPAGFDAVVHGSADSPGLGLEKTAAYNARLGLTAGASPTGHAFVNGKHFAVDDAFLGNMQTELGQQMSFLQQALYTGQIEDDSPAAMSTFFYDLPTTLARRTRYTHPSPSNPLRFVNGNGNAPGLFPEAFVYPPSEETKVPFTVYVVADLDSEAGLGLVKEVLESVHADSLARVSFVHNPASSQEAASPAHTSLLVSRLIQQASLPTVSPDQLLRALGVVPVALGNAGPQTVLSQEQTLRQLTGGVAFADFDAGVHADYVRSCASAVRELQLSPGEQGLVVNGRVVGPIGPGEFGAADFKDLLDHELRKRTGPVVEALESINPVMRGLDREAYAQIVSTASAIVSASQVQDPSEAGLFDAPSRPRLRNYRLLDGQFTKFEFGDEATAMFQVAVLLDPLSEAAQKWSTLMEWLTTFPDVHLYLQINPREHTELPLKRFYRYNVIPNLTFDSNGLEQPSEAAFYGLPVEPIYTLGMDVPQAWLVRPREAMYDLDNIQLSALSPEDTVKGVQALFDLDFLVVEGHARHSDANAPPRGVQLQLTNGNGTSIDDTQIVATLGYLQFKATPGVFQLEIREGRGRDIFELESAGNEGWESPPVADVGSEITVTNFEGLTLYPRLIRRPGMEHEDVLMEIQDAEEAPGLFEGIFSSIFSLFGSKNTDMVATGSPQADINIFTVASGLLYERFVSIMILSVMRNTKSTVKFWFIENFLSPSFLEFIPHLAEAYGFQYELVTYKWPSWLRAQKEKQRIIWAYKILFLDVLFPMDLKKVIFVDADQIVRADLQELVDLDLHGAPYGYTPMGDDNTDMEGFRFWKTGYWKDFLRGRPYHISALYVIDLVKFRQIAAGDMLRQQYQALSADPNSLANLDQDLPNNLQREIPIFSLPEDWLWCETWCSKDRLHRAKTIDLCQNPLTKEPKLARARSIPEWEVYDSEIAQFARKLSAEGLIRSDVAAVDVNVLAGSAPVAAPLDGTDGGLVKESLPIVNEEPQRDEL